jgi:hypothetical protein
VVLADDVGLMEIGAGLQPRRAVGVSASNRDENARIVERRIYYDPTSASISERRG